MKINYIKNGDYLIPNLGITTSTTNSINRYGLLKLNYIKKQLYRNLLMNNQLTDYLSSVSNDCNIKFETMMNNYKKKDKKLSEKNKMNNQMEWIKLMNNYKNVVDEVILKEDNVWLNANAIANLFNVQRPAIVKHINNIYSDEELDKD